MITIWVHLSGRQSNNKIANVLLLTGSMRRVPQALAGNLVRDIVLVSQPLMQNVIWGKRTCPRAIWEMAVRGPIGKRLVTRLIPDWRSYWYRALLFRPNSPGWL